MFSPGLRQEKNMNTIITANCAGLSTASFQNQVMFFSTQRLLNLVTNCVVYAK